MPFTTEEITSYTKKLAKGANKTPRKLLSSFLILSFTVSVTPSPESSHGFVILIVSATSSFEINKVNPFPALTAPRPVILYLNLYITLVVK